jgi:aspartate kinase/aspartokinase/homoserine dehydrogenase 1
VIKSLFKPDEPGTQVSSGGYEKEDIIKSVTFNKAISVLRIQGPGVGYKPGIIAQVGRILSDTGINIFSVITSQTSINLLVDKNDAGHSYNSLKQLKGGVIERINCEENIALIAVVGEGLLKKRGLAARVFAAVAEKEINIEMTSAGASEVAYYFIVKDSDLDIAIRAVHDEFFH